MRPKKNQSLIDRDLFKNEEEMQKVMGMNDLQKNMIISERLEKYEHLKEREMLFGGNRSKVPEVSTSRRRGGNNNRNNDYDSDRESGEILQKEEKKGRRRKKSELSDDDNVSSLGPLSDNENEKPKKENVPKITLEEIEKVKLTRNFFFKYNNLPNFLENVKNAFIRVNLRATGKQPSPSSGYIIGTIKEIFTQIDKPYNFMGSKCNKYVRLTHAVTDKDFDFKVISNSNILQEELKIWLEHLEKENQTPPTADELAEIKKKIDAIVNHKLSDEELTRILEEKKSDRIKYGDTSINITELLDLAYEKYREAKENFDKTKNKEFQEIMNKTEKEIKSLEKMKEERDKREKIRSENDIVVKINTETMKKQKIDDYKNSLLKKKRQSEMDRFEHNVFKRVECHPANLFDKQVYEKEQKKEEENVEKLGEKINEEEGGVDGGRILGGKKRKKKDKNRNYILTQKLKSFKKFIENEKGIIDEMMEYEKMKADNEKDKKDGGDYNSKIDMSFFFKLASINYKTYYKNINDENKKNTLDPKVKIIKLDDLFGNKNNNSD